MNEDLYRGKELDDFIERFRHDVLPHLKESASVLVIAPKDKNADLKIAIEVGCAILLSKPLIVFKPKGRMVAPRLLTIADHVIEGDMENETDRDRMVGEMKDLMKAVERRVQ